MSWTVEEWKEGVCPRVLQKIQELESQLDKLRKERQQRQFQLESLEAALQKQKQKVENEKNEAALLKRENQNLMELCDNLEKAKQKISHDLQAKESQINIQSGQLNSSKKDIERLEQELKRYKRELERSQQTSTAGDLSFSGAPQKSFTSPLTAVQSHNDTKFEELEEKYKKEVQKRKKLELELRAIHGKKINRPCPQSSLSHREISRHQASSSVFSWQQEKTLSRNQATRAKGSSAASSFPWEKETSSSVISEKNELNSSFANDCNSSLMSQLRAQNQELNSTVKDLEQQLQAQEKMKKSHMNKHQETELQLVRMKSELTEKDKALNKTRDKLTQTTAQLDQATTQVQMMEQKVKRLSEELNCQRHNAESARQSFEQKIKAKEKEYQQELSCQQRSLQTLDQQYNQIINKLHQELQQAKNDFNALQAEFDKVMAVKQRLECNTSDLTQKLCRAEQALLAAQTKETDLTKSFEEVKQEKNLLDCQLGKKLQEIYQLEEELKMINQSLKQSQSFAEEMKNKNSVQEAELKLLEEKFKKQESSLLLEKLQAALADMEKQQVSTQDLLKEKDNCIKEQNCKISKMGEELETLQKLLGLKQRECEELQKEATAFSQWKSESDCHINKLKSEKESLLTHVNDLERSLQSQQIKTREHSEKLSVMQTENDRKSTEIRLLSVEQMHESFVTETKQHISNLQADISVHQKLVEEKDMQLQTLNERLEKRQAELQDLQVNNKLLEDSVRQLMLLSGTWDSEKKDMSSMICSYSKKIEELTEENASLRDLSRTLEQGQVTLVEANKNLSDSLKEREETISELSRKHKEERERIESRTEEIKSELEALQAKHKSMEEENANMESILKEHTIEFEEKKAKSEQEKQFFSENKDILQKLTASEEIKKDFVQQLQQLLAEFSSTQNVPLTELESLRQEMLNVRAAPNTMQEESDILFQDKEQLGKKLEMKSKPLICDVGCEQRLHSEQLRKSIEEKDIELNKYQAKLELLQMDFEDRELSLENYRLEVMQLETALRGVEVELEKSMREKERLQELLSVKELKASDDDGHSLEYNYDDVSQNCGKKGMEESFSSLVLASSLQVMLNNLSKLEKMCERLQTENIALASGFEDSKNNGSTGIDKVAEEKENIMDADRHLKAEEAIFPDELMDQSDSSDLRMYSGSNEMSFTLKECSTGSSLDYKDLKLSSKEVKIHFAEVRQKLLSFQNEHMKLYEQHRSMSSKVSELQSCIEMLKAENSALSTSMNNAHTASVKGPLSSSQSDTLPNSDETKSTVSSSDLLQSPCFIEVSEVIDSCNRGTCKWVEEMNQPGSSAEIIPEDATKALVENCCNDHKSDSVREPSFTPRKSNLESKIEELQMLCQTYDKAIKVFKDQFRIQENMKNEEIQELKNVILSERNEIDYLKQKNLSDKEEWQQKLHNVTMEMEGKLAAEREQTENLSLELEAARLQLRVLDLSSHSLLCSDIENMTDQETSTPYRLGVPTESSALKNKRCKLIPIEKMAVGGPSVCENATETTEARLTENYTEISGEHEGRNMSGKISSPSDHASALSVSNNRMCLSAGYFSENQITTEMLQEEAKQQTAENLKRIHKMEESHKHVDLLTKVEQLNWELNFQNLQLAPKSSAFAELEEAAVVVKEENCGIKEILESVSVNNRQFSHTLENEAENINSELEVYKVRFPNTADTLDDGEKTQRGCPDQFVAAENKQRSPKSEQGNIKNHVLFTEHDTEMLQAKCQLLEREMEVNLKTISSLQEQLVSVTAERNHINQELSILTENKKELDHKYQKLQEKLKELESAKVDSAEFIRRLESEVRTQTNLLETAKSDVNQLSNEKEHLLQKLRGLENDVASFTLEKEKLQNEAADLKKEKELIVRELEITQNKLSSSEVENSKFSRSLEVLLMEKGELAARLSLAQEEVDQMRHGIEKLKVKIELDEKKKLHIAQKLKDSERNADCLLDKIERLERELEMSEKNLEDAIIQMETAKAEAETVTVEMEEMTEKLKCLNVQIDVLTSQKECLAKDLKEKQEKLEAEKLTTVKLLEEKEEEKLHIKEEFENAVALLKSELKEMSEKLEEEGDARAKEQVLINQVAHLEHDKAILFQECQELKNEKIRLDQMREELVQELTLCKQKLSEKVQENSGLEKEVKETEEMSLQLTRMHQEHAHWQQEKERLLNLVAELKLKEQHFPENETFPAILNVLKVSYEILEKELESTHEKSTLCEKVNDLMGTHSELRVKLSDAEQKISKLQEELTTERDKLAAEIQLLQEHSEKSKIQMHQTMSERNELTERLAMVQKELQEKESEMKREISEYKTRLLQAEKEHQDALTEANRKADNIIVQQKKEDEFTHSEVQLWMKSCKQMEQEKEMLQKQLVERDELLNKENLAMTECRKEGADENAVMEEMKLKLEELQESTKVKTREANENLEKYCSLIVKHYKLEEENEVLKTQVSLLSAQLKQPTSDLVSTPSLISDNSLTGSNQSVKEMRAAEDATKLSSKRQRHEGNRKDNGEPRSPVPETLSKKKRKDDVYQDLLGFTDTTSGKVSPCVLHRTTLNLRTSPHLASPSEKLTLPVQGVLKRRSDNLGERSSSTSGGSKPQKVYGEEKSQAVTALSPMQSTSRSRLCPCKQSTKSASDNNTTESHMMHKGESSLNQQGLPEQEEQNEYCNVQ